MYSDGIKNHHQLLLLYKTGQQSCWGGILVSLRPSICPSVRPSRMPCPLCNIYSCGWILFILGTNDQYHERVCRAPWPVHDPHVLSMEDTIYLYCCWWHGDAISKRPISVSHKMPCFKFLQNPEVETWQFPIYKMMRALKLYNHLCSSTTEMSVNFQNVRKSQFLGLWACRISCKLTFNRLLEHHQPWYWSCLHRTILHQ